MGKNAGEWVECMQWGWTETTRWRVGEGGWILFDFVARRCQLGHQRPILPPRFYYHQHLVHHVKRSKEQTWLSRRARRGGKGCGDWDAAMKKMRRELIRLQQVSDVDDDDEEDRKLRREFIQFPLYRQNNTKRILEFSLRSTVRSSPM